jgi:hypothetical protein
LRSAVAFTERMKNIDFAQVIRKAMSNIAVIINQIIIRFEFRKDVRRIRFNMLTQAKLIAL